MRVAPCLCLVLLVLSTATAWAVPRFQSSNRSDEVPLYPVSAAVEDFDHDGRPDLAVASSFYATLGITLLKGFASGFAVVDTIPVQFPSAVAAGHLDDDEHADLVVASRNVTYVLLGNGDLTFQPAQANGTYLNGASGGYGLDLADVTGDGILDIVVCDSIELVRMRPGVGDGTFGPPTRLPISSYADGLKAVDLDGDDDRDLVVSDAGDVTYQLTVFLNLGAGLFDDPTVYPGDESTSGLAIGDVDGDGDPDLVGGRNLYLGNGDGTFAGAAPLVGESELSPLLADLDHDGELDLVTVESLPPFGPGRIQMRKGIGDGTFESPASRHASVGGTALVAADADTDGRTDLIACGSSWGQVCVFRGLGPPGLEPNAPELAMPGLPEDVAVAEATGDAFADVLGVTTLPPNVRLFSGNGDLTLDAPVDLAAPANVRRVAVGDFDDDGFPDLVTANGSSGTISQFRGTGGGTFAARTDHAASGTILDVVVADIGGDGFDDAIAIGSGGLRLFPGQAGGGFAARIDRALGGTRVATGDLNGDPYPDFVGLAGGVLHTFFGQAGGGLSAGTVSAIGLFGSETPDRMATLDLDGDTDDDVIVSAYISLRLKPVLNDGSGGLTAAPLIPGSRRMISLESGDVDGDGIDDLVASSSSLNCATVFLGTGSGVVLDAGYGASGPVNDAALGDLDGDGFPELVTADDLTTSKEGPPGAISVMRNSNSVVLSVPEGSRARHSTLAISRVWPTMARSELHLDFALPARGEAVVELYDVGGRRLQRENLGLLEAGSQRRSVTLRTGIPAGIVWVRLRQGNAWAAARAVVAR